MKKLLIALVLCSCNQHIYDLIYSQIITVAMKEKEDERAFRERNAAIENLRALCNGQRSTFELDKPCEVVK